MPRSPSTGVFTRVSNSFSNPVYGTVIDPTDANSLFDDYDSGLTFNDASPLELVGSTSGILTILAPDTASGTITLPAGTTDFSSTGGTGQFVKQDTAGGAFTVSTVPASEISSGAALTRVDDTNVTLTLGGSPSTSLLAATSITAGWTGQLSLTRGGTNASLTASNGGILYSTASAAAILAGTATANLPLLSGATAAPSWASVSYPTSATSGGVPYFSSTTAMASSAALAANQIVIGGGAGAAPATLGSLGTTTTVLHGNAAGAPTFGAVSLTADVSGTLPVANGGTGAASQTAYAVLCGGTTSTGAYQSIASVGTAAQVLASNGAGALPSMQSLQDCIEFVIDGGGATITTGVKGDLEIPYNCTVTRWTLLGDQSGSIVVDLWVDTYANYPPTVADTITGSALPTISTATKGQSSTLTGWTTALTSGSTLRFNVNSVTSLTRVTLSLKVTRTSVS